MNKDALRFWAKIDFSHPNGCWVWTASLTAQGRYAYFTIGRKKRVYAHRYAYELLVGPIPPGLQIDHLCRNTVCVNPAHLEPVTSRENTLRGESPWAVNARKTHCKRGHEFTPENTYTTPTGWRKCRTCTREQQRLQWPRRREMRQRARLRKKQEAAGR